MPVVDCYSDRKEENRTGGLTVACDSLESTLTLRPKPRNCRCQHFWFIPEEENHYLLTSIGIDLCKSHKDKVYVSIWMLTDTAPALPARRHSKVIKSSYIYSLLISRSHYFPDESLAEAFLPASFVRRWQQRTMIFIVFYFMLNKSSIYFESLCVIFYGRSNSRRAVNAVRGMERRLWLNNDDDAIF